MDGSSSPLDALALEYKRDYGTARRNLNVADLVNNPAAGGKCRVFGLSFTEQTLDRLLGQGGPLGDHSADPFLVTLDTVEPLAKELLLEPDPWGTIKADTVIHEG